MRMMHRMRMCAAVSSVAALAMALTACGGGGAGDGDSTSEAFDPNAKTTITFAGWSLKQSPEFEALANAFHESHPNVTVQVKEYSADDYDSQLIVDLSGGNAPSVFPIKNLQKYYTYAKESEGLLDVTDIAQGFAGDANIDMSSYDLDGRNYAIPYRQDSYVLFYNKTMFDKAGVATPDGTWTWDDFMNTAEELKDKLPAAGYDAGAVKPAYFHIPQAWPFNQAMALAQSDLKAEDTYFKGDYSYIKPFFERQLKIQQEGLALDFNTVSANKVQYQAQFGTQKAAMMPMGTWYVSTLVKQQKSGAAEQFEWGMAPVPQTQGVTSKTGNPITYGDPSGLAVSRSATEQQRAAAKEFVKWCAGEEGATVLAKIAATPAYFSSKVVDTYFQADGVPSDDLSKKAWREHDTRPENPVGASTDSIMSILKTAGSGALSGTQSIDEALADASKQVRNTVLQQ